ncbi:hypothetical protein KAS08_06140 [Candidatus Pacearchaeota archaeon]|nr:hypothetical protein [Candidatus Pacearchaeota archaeon]
MKKLFSLLFIASFFFVVVSATDVSVDYSSDTMIKGVNNYIEMTLEVADATPGFYNLYTLSDMIITPSEVFVVTNNSFVKTFGITTGRDLDFTGKYAFSHVLNHRNVEKIKTNAVIKFVDLRDAVVVGSDTIDSESGIITFYVENLESTTVRNLTGRFSSILFSTEETFDLGPKEKHEITVIVDAEELKKTKAGVYIIKSVFDTAFGDVEMNGNLYLGEKKGITSSEDKSGLLVRTHTISKINSGNVVQGAEVELTYNILSRFFTTFNIKPALTEREGFSVRYTWEKNRLNPAEVYVIKAKTNYILPFFILIFAIFGLWGLKKFNEIKLEIKKTVTPVKTKNGEFALKIRLAIKAKTDVEKLTLTDRVPAMVKIYKKFISTAPDKIDANTRRIHWSVGDLASGETRVFNYIVFSKVGIVGKFVLPEAKVIFIEDEKRREEFSNKVFFMNDQN